MNKIITLLKKNLVISSTAGVLLIVSILVSLYGFTGIVGASSFVKEIPEVKSAQDLNKDSSELTPTPSQSVDNSQDSISLTPTPSFTPTPTSTVSGDDHQDLDRKEFEEDNDTEDFHSDKNEVENEKIKKPETER